MTKEQVIARLSEMSEDEANAMVLIRQEDGTWDLIPLEQIKSMRPVGRHARNDPGAGPFSHGYGNPS